MGPCSSSTAYEICEFGLHGYQFSFIKFYCAVPRAVLSDALSHAMSPDTDPIFIGP